MIILSIDSATPVAGVAVVDEEKIWAENFLNTGYTHSQQLMPMIAQTLKQADLKIADIDAIAVSKGPGSFTGLRIGMATAKGMAQVSGKKLIGISTLDTLAYNLWGNGGIICPILNARKQEVYTALYKMQNGTMVRSSEYWALSPEDLGDKLLEINEPVWFLGDGVFEYQETLVSKLGHHAYWPPLNNLLPRASSLALLGIEQLKKGEEDNLFTMEPFYLRKSEAEVKWEAKQCLK